LNLEVPLLEVSSQPVGAQYAESTIYQPGDSVSVVLDGQPAGTVPVADLLPPASGKPSSKPAPATPRLR
jgi:hypothetical protein